MLPEFRTVDELGAQLWPSWDAQRRRRFIYRAVEEKAMPAVRCGRALMFEVTAVADWFASQRIGDWSSKTTKGDSGEFSV